MIPELSAMLEMPRHMEMLLRNDEVNEENPEVSLTRLADSFRAKAEFGRAAKRYFSLHWSGRVQLSSLITYRGVDSMLRNTCSSSHTSTIETSYLLKKLRHRRQRISWADVKDLCQPI